MDPLRPLDRTVSPRTVSRQEADATPVQPRDRVEMGTPAMLVPRAFPRRGAAEPPAPAEPLSLIISAPDGAERAELKKLFLERDPQTRITADLPLIHAFAVELPPNSIGVLPELGKVARGVRVFLDGDISIPEPEQQAAPVHPNLDAATHALGLQPLWDKGITGKGVTICVIDTGVAQHPDLKSHIVAFKDLVNGRTDPYDDQGHGTHVSSIAAGDGQASEGRYKGCAPEASIVGVKVLDSHGSGSFSSVIAGIQWAVENRDRYGIKVINLSLGGRVKQSYKDDPVAQAIEAASAAGIVPVVAAGNNGPGAQSIATPAHAPHALTVAADDDRGTPDRSDDAIASFSSRGPTPIDSLAKLDVAAPGVDITAADWRGGYRTLSGTSMATPMVAGVAALLLQARPGLTPDQVKDLLMRTADPLKEIDASAQGSGVVDAARALEAPLPQPPAP